MLNMSRYTNSANHGRLEGTCKGVDVKANSDGSHRALVKLAVPDAYRDKAGQIGRQYVRLAFYIPENRPDLIDDISKIHDGDLIRADFTVHEIVCVTASETEKRVNTLEVVWSDISHMGCMEQELDYLPIKRALQMNTDSLQPLDSTSSNSWCIITPERRNSFNSVVVHGNEHYNACNYGFAQGTVEFLQLTERQDGGMVVSLRMLAPRCYQSASGEQKSDGLYYTVALRPGDEEGKAFFGGISEGDELKVCYQVRGEKRHGEPLYRTALKLISAEKCA